MVLNVFPALNKPVKQSFEFLFSSLIKACLSAASADFKWEILCQIHYDVIDYGTIDRVLMVHFPVEGDRYDVTIYTDLYIDLSHSLNST